MEILCRCLPSQDLVRHCPLLPPPLGGHFETVCRGSKVGGGERGPKPGARAPRLSTPSLPCLGAPPQNAPPSTSSPHRFLHLPNHSSHFKDCGRVLLSSTPLRPRDAKFLEPMFPFQGGSVVLLLMSWGLSPGSVPIQSHPVAGQTPELDAVLANPAQPRAECGASGPSEGSALLSYPSGLQTTFCSLGLTLRFPLALLSGLYFPPPTFHPTPSPIPHFFS